MNKHIALTAAILALAMPCGALAQNAAPVVTAASANTMPLHGRHHRHHHPHHHFHRK